jgi:hypothetical protein
VEVGKPGKRPPHIVAHQSRIQWKRKCNVHITQRTSTWVLRYTSGEAMQADGANGRAGQCWFGGRVLHPASLTQGSCLHDTPRHRIESRQNGLFLGRLIHNNVIKAILFHLLTPKGRCGRLQATHLVAAAACCFRPLHAAVALYVPACCWISSFQCLALYASAHRDCQSP